MMKKEFKRLLRENYRTVLFIYIAFFAMCFVSFLIVSDIMKGQMEHLGVEKLNTAQESVSSILSESQLEFGNMADTVQTMVFEEKTNEELLTYLKNRDWNFKNGSQAVNTDFMKVYGYFRNEFLDGSGWVPPEDYDAKERPWYIGALKQSGIFFTEPYQDADSGDMCISFSQKILDKSGYPAGVFSIDLDLSRIVDYMENLQLENNGYGVLIDDHMTFVGHPKKSFSGKSLYDLGGEYGALANKLKVKSTLRADSFVDNEERQNIIFFDSIFNEWHIGLIIPRTDYYQQVFRLAGILAVLGAFLATGLSLLVLQTKLQQKKSEEESRSKSRFLSQMSHEMRTPLNAIIGMTEIAKRVDDVDKIKENLENIDVAANHLLGVINDVLDISKIESGKFVVSETEFVFTAMLGKIKSVIGQRAEEKRIQYTVNIDDNIPYSIITDDQRLAQVITNLLSNAVKFTSEGGRVTLNIKKQSDMEDGCILYFEVIDNGIGITEEQLERLFQSFEQADKSISRKYGGSGLGLAISKTIVENLGGTIGVESKQGDGSKFFFTVAVKKGDMIRPQTVVKAKPPEKVDYTGIFKGYTVLIAEDIEINRVIIKKLLEETGVEMKFAGNGRIAFQMFDAEPLAFDLIFMDIHMPEMDGFECTRKIRSTGYENSKSIPIIAMTADVFTEDINSCIEAGMNDHTGKPIKIEEVIGKMQKFFKYGTMKVE